MPLVELSRPLKLSDLEIGNVFERSEVIVQRNADSMVTVAWESGFDFGESYDIKRFMYDLRLNQRGEVENINCNGYGEIYSDDTMHDAYAGELKKAGLFPEE